MVRSQKQKTRFRPVGHGLVLAVLLLLPVLAVVGALAPGLVTAQYEEDEEFKPRRRPQRRPVRLPPRPLFVPRDYSAGFVPEMVDLEPLFAGPRYRVEATPRLTRLPSFPRSRGDVIVLADLDPYIADLLFEDALQPAVVADPTAIWDVARTESSRHRQFDDFTGQEGEDPLPPPVVPEPGTGSLVALGLLGLALGARQRQPATS